MLDFYFSLKKKEAKVIKGVTGPPLEGVVGYFSICNIHIEKKPSNSIFSSLFFGLFTNKKG
jgi:hypothetical protein